MCVGHAQFFLQLIYSTLFAKGAASMWPPAAIIAATCSRWYMYCALQLLAEKGVQFQFQTTAKEFIGENGKLKQVVLTDGTVLPAEFCVIGIGKTSFQYQQPFSTIIQISLS